ncbi:MAG: leucine-rich repeat domain-containing protein [Bacteroidales bacterium]|nr:leucine-rich repeat domain-containing protein [Bacteroidales bacterium]
MKKLIITLSAFLATIGGASAQQVLELTTAIAPEVVKTLTKDEKYIIKVSGQLSSEQYFAIVSNAADSCEIDLNLSNCYGLDTIQQNATTRTINKYSKSIVALRLPLDLKCIGDFAFNDACSLKYITIQDKVESIGRFAFSHNDSLEEIALPNSVTTIMNDAFYFCGKLRKITIGNNIKKLYPWAFNTHSSLFIYISEATDFISDGIVANPETKIVRIPESLEMADGLLWNTCSIFVDPRNRYYHSDNGYLYNKDKTELIFSYPQPPVLRIDDGVRIISARITSDTIYIPASLDSIRYNYTFKYFVVDQSNNRFSSQNGCLLTKDGKILIQAGNRCDIVVPDGVTKIQNGAIYPDSAIMLILPKSLREIEDGGISYRCKVTIPKNVCKIGIWNYNSNWQFAQGNKSYCAENNVLYNKAKTKILNARNADSNYDIPPTVESIGYGSFAGNKRIKSVKIPDSVTEIGDSAFARCESLSEIVFNERLESIGKYTFDGCSNIVAVSFPKAIKSIGKRAFSNTNIKNLSLPENLEFLDKDAFHIGSSGVIVNVPIPERIKFIAPQRSILFKFIFSDGIDNLYITPDYDNWLNCKNGIPVSDFNYPEQIKKMDKYDNLNSLSTLSHLITGIETKDKDGNIVFKWFLDSYEEFKSYMYVKRVVVSYLKDDGSIYEEEQDRYYLNNYYIYKLD